MSIGILLGGGRKLLREGLALLLERQQDLKLVAEAAEVSAVPKLVRALPVEVAVLIESSIATISVQQVAAIFRAKPDVRVIILALNPAVQWIHGMLDLGVLGCLTRDSAAEDLTTALRSVARGQVYLAPQLVHLVVSAQMQSKSANRQYPRLAPREREILRRISEGQITKQIAAEMGIGSKTVETHRQRLMAKLNAFTVADLTKCAIRQGLTTLEASV